MANKKTNQFETSKLHLITFLRLKNIRPFDRTEEDNRCAVFYERTKELDAALLQYMNRCDSCGISWEDVEGAFSEAKRMLLDGDLGNGKNGTRKGGR